MNILVIGNGFDVAHGLPTKYQRFLGFVYYFGLYAKGFNINDVLDYEHKNNSKYYIKYFEKLKDEIKKEYTDLINNNILFEHFTNVYKEKLKNKQNWIDFEAEISNVIQELDRIRKHLLDLKSQDSINSVAKIHTEYRIIVNLNEYLQENCGRFDGFNFTLQRVAMIKNILLNDLNSLTRCLELYLTDFIEYDKCKKNKLISDIDADFLLNFNYTDTYLKTYVESKRHGSFVTNKTNYIHGRAKKENTIENCDLVLGIEEYLEGDDRNKDNEYIEFKKFYQRIFKGTGSKYKTWLNRNKDERIFTYIFGHSIATTDGDIIKNLIEASYKTTIYYHSKDALHDIILNLVQIIGVEELITRTSDDSRSIIFKPTP